MVKTIRPIHAYASGSQTPPPLQTAGSSYIHMYQKIAPPPKCLDVLVGGLTERNTLLSVAGDRRDRALFYSAEAATPLTVGSLKASRLTPTPVLYSARFGGPRGKLPSSWWSSPAGPPREEGRGVDDRLREKSLKARISFSRCRSRSACEEEEGKGVWVAVAVAGRVKREVKRKK